MTLPQNCKYLIVGAGIHGLSTAFHLAQDLKASGRGSGSDILVIDKSDIAAGASGIACGVIRNNYFQSSMRELMAHSVEVWESDPQVYSYHPVGYLQVSPKVMEADVAGIHAEQKAIGYESEFICGTDESAKYMCGIFHDWQARGITSVLHEKKGGYANNKKAMHGLANKAKELGVQFALGVEVEDIDVSAGRVKGVETSQGRIECEFCVIALGPWVKRAWEMLGLPRRISLKREESVHEVPMWKYWSLQEGTLGVDPNFLQNNEGQLPPVVHMDTDAPLYSDLDGSLLCDEIWGLYYKPDFSFGGIQGGAAPFEVARDPDEVQVDPYGPESPEFVVDDNFARMWCSALAFCQKRFEGQYPKYKQEPSGGIGALAPDSFPVFDIFRENCYVVADSNHGFKMIGVGQLVAKEIQGQRQSLLEPFRFARFEQGKLHPVSNSPFPWS